MSKETEQEIEIRIDSLDDRLVDDIVDTLRPLGVQRWPRARIVDPITILSVVGSTVALVNGLLTLREKLASAKSPVKVIVSTEDASVTLAEADSPQIESMLKTPAPGQDGSAQQ